SSKRNDPYLLDLVGKVLRNLAALQGQTLNIESGEEPGKCIHEFRPDNHAHLTEALIEPWYVYPDGSMRNYDSVDATPLFLITLDAYLRTRASAEESAFFAPFARAAIDWLLNYGDTNGDGFIDYRFPSERVHGGLRVQNWMDSSESVFFEEDNNLPQYPIAPVEVQAYTYTALSAWSEALSSLDPVLSARLRERAAELKGNFNELFVVRHGRHFSLIAGIDGTGRPLTSERSSMAHCLWATRKKHGISESILDPILVPRLVRRLLRPDLYVPGGGIRTLSSRSSRFDPHSYHNGSIWPHDTTMFAEGLENFGYIDEAREVRASIVHAYEHFKTPLELFTYRRGLREYAPENGRGACRTQAWSAASILSVLAEFDDSEFQNTSS
ncbi:MAG TPA: amylo-alpha-1,6-glucosidase, partial [Candidatus Paceibacterota bacterium]|nr:amylo-alpha-1,6-glucosidase [Candidatus Paceibacterota bacterium]